MTSDNPNKDFNDECSRFSSASLLETGVLDANPIIYMSQAEKNLEMPKLLENFLSVFSSALISNWIMRKEIAPRGIDIKLFYNMPNINIADTMHQEMTCNTNNGSETFSVPSDYNDYCKREFNSENEGLSVTSLNGLKIEYTKHTLKHPGDGEVIHLAMTHKKEGSHYVVTEERDKKNKKSLEDALKINNISYYSIFCILPTMTARGLIKEKEMLKIAEYLSCSNITNHLVSENLLIETTKRIKNIKDSEASP